MISDENLNVRTSEEKSFQTEMCVYKGWEGMTKTKAGAKMRSMRSRRWK